MNNVEHCQVGITVMLSFLSYCFGVNPALEFLVWCVVLDLVIGILASFINPKLCFNSRRMFKGITKKIVLFSMVVFSHQLDKLMHTEIICMTTTYFFIVNEGFSVLENCGKAGIKLPKILENSLQQVKELSDIDKNKRH